MKRRLFHIFFLLFCAALFSCHDNNTDKEEEEIAPGQVQTPVTVTSISREPLSDYAELNATSAFLQENIIKSNINGYIKSVNLKLGQYVKAGQTLFILRTKEAESLGNTINKLDSSFHFSGISRIIAPQSGYISQQLHQVGDYVQDGEALASISGLKSFGFILNLPYELRKYVSLNKNVEVILADGTHLKGTISLFMPDVDSLSQTQKVLVSVAAAPNIPENLVARVHILKMQKLNTVSLPRQAVLSDESQSNFWVMKMIDSVRAVKIPVIKGMETADRVEILKPEFSINDKIILTGNYGLPDTARVKIVKGESKPEK